jgi:hypothetical protein
MVFLKEVSLGNVLTLLGMAGIVMLGFAKLQTRLTLLEAANTVRTQQIVDLRNDIREARQDIKTLVTVLLKESKEREQNAEIKK